jgi:hypothetical protein
MSFDADIYFPDPPEGFAAAWQRDMAAHGLPPVKVLVPVHWRTEGVWYITDPDADDLPAIANPPAPDETWDIYVQPVTPEVFVGRHFSAQDLAQLANARYVAGMNLGHSAATYLMMCAVTLAKAVNGTVWDPQGYAGDEYGSLYGTALCAELADQWFESEARNQAAAETFASAPRNWEKPHRSKQATTYCDPASIVREGPRISVWTLMDFHAPATIDRTTRMSQAVHAEFDCPGRRYRPLGYIYYAGNMASGEVVRKETYRVSEGEWMKVDPGTYLEALRRYACGPRLTLVEKLVSAVRGLAAG